MANDSRPSPGRPKRYTRDALIDAVRAAAGGRYLSLRDYDRWRRQHDSPSSRAICRRLGPRWPTVLENAGIPRQTFQDRTARGIAALQDLWRELGYRPSYLDWQRWRGKPRGSKTIWRHFGSWVKFRDAAWRADPDLLQPWSRSWAVRRLLAIPDAMLTPRERYLAACLRQGMTMQAAGETVGITRPRVYQLARAAGRRYDPMPPISSQPSNAGAQKQTREDVTPMHNQTAQPPLVEELPPRRGPHWELGETYLITLQCGNCRLNILAKLTKGHQATGLQGLTAPCPHCDCVEWYHPVAAATREQAAIPGRNAAFSGPASEDICASLAEVGRLRAELHSIVSIVSRPVPVTLQEDVVALMSYWRSLAQGMAEMAGAALGKEEERS